MVGVIAGLEGKGFIKRNSTPSTSARVLVAQVTPSGRRAFAKAATRFEIIDTALDSAFSDAERQRLISLLSKMREVFEELDGSLSSDP
jgi:DNA-binding MarR family transcriptional regulator